MRRHAILVRTAAALAALLLLGGCTGSLFESKIKPASIYLLSAHAGERGPALAADLAVLKPEVRAGLDTDRIAALYPDRHLDYFAGARWSAPLDEVIQQLGVQSFRAHARLRDVVADTSSVLPDYWLELEVVDFQAEYAANGGAPTIHAHILARLGRAREVKPIGSFDVRVERKAAANRLTPIIASYEDAADAALAQIVADTVHTLRQERAPRRAD